MSASASKHPRNLGQFFNGNKSMSGEVPVQKPTTPIVDRFNAMVREREAEISRVSSAAAAADDDDEGIVRLYELVLSELTSNSKPLITDLTVIARERREHGQGIAGAICARILEVPGEQKLRFLYLLDSIAKNIGKEYVRYFSFHLPKVFCEAYRQAHPNLYSAMRHLFRTWSTVFPPSVLGNIEAQLQFSPSADHQSSVLTSLRAFESPRPTHGIHVNPKYLEARRQFEQSAADSSNQHAKVRTSTVKLYGRKPGSGYDEYDSNNAEVMSSMTGVQRLSSTGHVGGTSFTLGAEKLAPSSDSRFARSSSSLRTQHARSLSAPGDEFAVNSSPRKVVDRASPSHLGFEYGLGRMNGREEESSDWPRTHWSDGAYRRFETSAAHNNGVELQGPRALIHAYGNNQSRQTPTSKPLKIDTIGVDDKVGTRTWQNTEEEEFDWEDMSPNFVGSSQSDNLLASSMHPLDSYTTIPGNGKHSAAPRDTDLSRSNGSSEAQISAINDSSISLEHVVPTVSSGCGSSSNITGLCDETTQFLGFHYPREARDFPSSLAQASQCCVSSEGPRDFQMYPSSGGVQKPLINGFLDSSAQHHGSCFVASSMGTARTDSWKSKALSTVVPPSTGPWPPLDLHTSHALPMLPRLPLHQFDSINGCNKVLNQGLTKSFLPELQFTSTEKNVPSSLKLHSFPHRQARPIPSNPQYPEQVTSARPQLLPSQDIWQNLVLPKAVTTPSVVPPLTHGYTPQWHNTGTSNVLSNPIPGVHPSMAILNTPSRSLHLHGGGLLPLPLGPHPVSSQMIPISHNPIAIAPDLQAGTAFSGLIDSLMAQGLISLTSQAPVKDSVGPAFNPDILKVRHESAVTALYADLPRQCTTCGHRFKCQEEHSSHMDWHVTKNRISKSRKQKPSRKWFVNVSLWLTGAEALGTDAIPGFLPAESVVEQKDDEDFAVPADEDQNSCALCGEPFDDFYSDEIEEWMYKGAVYLNAPSKSTKNIDRSHLGPIVHAKCRSESSAVSPEDFGQDEGGYIGDGSQRKRLRSSLI